MSSSFNPRPWVPYMNTKDCSQGFCSLYCPQWCYIIFPPPPPPPASLEFPDDDSGPTFSPLVIAIIGILASAFLLVSYYAIISKYCGNMDSARSRENQDPNDELEDQNDHDPSNHEPWHVANTGLDEALIKSITVCKYNKGDGLIEGTDCSVCLSEFEEGESVRLLPKCSHAFHVTCIDTWLRSHSNCPLCRANIMFVNAPSSPLPPPLPPPILAEPSLRIESLPVNNSINDLEELGVRDEEEILQNDCASPKMELRDLCNSDEGDTIIEIRDDENDGRQLRRSASMDYLCQNRVVVVSIADVLRLREDVDFEMEERDVGSSKEVAAEMSKSSQRSRSLQYYYCVTSPVAMKRSISSGRFCFSSRGKGHNIMMPL